jgi:arylsulfatase A
MITYMDHVVGKILDRLKQHGIEDNTLVLFTGDNGTHRKITSKLDRMDLKGGKGTMTEAGSRVPLLARWPGTVQPGVRDQFFCLVDILPTIAAVAGIKLETRLDGMDLSHNLFGKTGQDREHVLINYGRGYFVRDKRFRLNQDGTFYDIPITSDRQRYSEKQSDNPAYAGDRQRLRIILDEFMTIQPEYKSGR